MCGHSCSSTKMLSPFVSWILSSPSSSSSSSTEEEEEESLDIDNTIEESDHENDIVVDHELHKDKTNIPNEEENEHYLSSCDVEDTIPIALAVGEASPTVTVAFPATDERTTIPAAAAAAATTIVTRSKRQRTANHSGIVRQYQRLWTKQDEIELLKGYLDFMKQNKGATNSLQNDVALFYDDIRLKLNVGFNMNQLVEKLRRLKRKHKVALDKGNSGKEVSFKNPQDEAIYKISSKIWANNTDQGDELDLGGGGSGGGDDNHQEVKVKIEQVENCDEMDKKAVKRLRFSEHKDGADVATSHIQRFIEETMKSCFSPMMKELLDDTPERPPKQVELWRGEAGDEEWRKKRISELEVYLNQLELLQDQIKAKLEELRSGRG